ncbi:rhodanese-like domain-containing protein [Rubripirellula tenax]|nr:rhodanese-like domain-containing protein [Rubripirellula tenax]
MKSILLAMVCFASMACGPNATITHAQLGGFFGGSPHVAKVDAKELNAMLTKQSDLEKSAEASGKPKPTADFVVVDVRTDAEVNVSVIPGAITKADYEKNRDRYAGRMVIPYCTIGGRSGRYALELQKQGIPVKNFKGSILEWASEELPLVTLDGKPTTQVHIYSDTYSVPPMYQPVTR